MRLEVHGTKGTLRLINDTTVEVLDVEGKPQDTSMFEQPDGVLEDVEGELANLYQAIRHGAALGVTVDEGYHHLAFVVAALDAADHQRVAKVSTLE